MKRNYMNMSKVYARYRYSLILLRELVITDFKLRYQGSVLGYAWSLLKPLFMFAIIYTIFVLILDIGADQPHWGVALLTGMVMWNFFSEVTNGGLKAIVNRGGLIRKINFPKYIIIISGTVSAFINLIFNTFVIAVFMVINGVEPSWTMLLAPVFVIEVFVFAMGLSFILSTLYVKFRDIQHIWEIIMQGLFYASIIIYPLSKVVNINPDVAKILMLNPIAQAIQDLRHFVIAPGLENTSEITSNILIIAFPFILTVVVFVFGAMYFRARAPYFAEEV